MKILITGATGFIASRLIPYLIKKGYNVDGLSRRKVKKPNIYQISLLNSKKLNKFLKKKQYDVIVHLAAQIEEKTPISILSNNYKTTLNLLQSCKNNNSPKFIFASTHGVYGKTNYVPIDEEHQLNPISNYAISKLISENVCKLFNNSYELNLNILRISSVYGEGQNLKRLIPSLLSNSLTKKKMVIYKYNNGFQIMDLIHIDDVCRAIDLSIKSKKKFGIYNIASGHAITAEDIAKNISKISKSIIQIKKINKTTNHFFYDISKAKKEIKFKPIFKVDSQNLKNILNDISKRINLD